MIHRYLGVFCITVLFLQTAFSQEELGLHFMQNVWQSNKTNPALLTETKLTIGLPSFYFNVASEPLVLNDLVTTNAAGQNILDKEKILNNLTDNNSIQTNIEIETFNVAFGLKKFRFNVAHGIKFNTYFTYPEDLAKFVFNGNGAYVGETLNVGPEFHSFAYNEFVIGAAVQLPKLSIGVKGKVLTGIGDASTERNKISLFTDDDVYQLTLNTDFRINTSSFLSINDLSSFDFELNNGLSSYSTSKIFTQNLGFAFDLGLVFKPIEKLSIAASIVDVGQINWTDNVTNYSSNKSFQYDGIDLVEVLQDGDLSFAGTLDTFDQILNFDESNDNYSTKLNAKTYLSASYDLNESLTIAGLWYTETVRENTSSSVAISAQKRFAKILSLGAVYSIRNNTYDNFGINFSAKLGPIQLYGLTDNILAAFDPYANKNANARIGLNLLF